jgi:hypothetical protein
MQPNAGSAEAIRTGTKANSFMAADIIMSATRKHDTALARLPKFFERPVSVVLMLGLAQHQEVEYFNRLSRVVAVPIEFDDEFALAIRHVFDSHRRAAQPLRGDAEASPDP